MGTSTLVEGIGGGILGNGRSARDGRCRDWEVSDGRRGIWRRGKAPVQSESRTRSILIHRLLTPDWSNLSAPQQHRASSETVPNGSSAMILE